MARKRNTPTETTHNQPELAATEDQMSATESSEGNGVQHTNACHEESAPDTNADDDPNAGYQILLEAEADKLSPRSPGKITFQIAKETETGKNRLRLHKNDGGGLHTHEWIDLQLVIDTISTQEDRPWKSALLKTTMKGRSSNNCSLLAACLRSPELGLAKQSDKSQFLHVLSDDFEAKAKALIERA